MISFSNLGQMGRLGNAIFQICATVCLAKKNDDLPIFPNWQYQNDFNLNQSWFGHHIRPDRIYREPHFHYSPIPYNIQKHQTLDLVGYLQDWNYWTEYEDYIKELFSFKNPINSLNNYCSIHIRRGDYLQFKNAHTNLDMSYYNTAMNIVKSDKYLIFSDDISYCKSVFKGPQFEFSENNNVITDFQLMQACKNNIIANSSFSLLAAWFNSNSDKKVISPNYKIWFGPQLKQHNTSNLIPKEWIQI